MATIGKTRLYEAIQKIEKQIKGKAADASGAVNSIYFTTIDIPFVTDKIVYTKVKQRDDKSQHQKEIIQSTELLRKYKISSPFVLTPFYCNQSANRILAQAQCDLSRLNYNGKNIIEIIGQLVLGLEILHQNNLVLIDINLRNCLYFETGRVAFTDLDYVKEIESTESKATDYRQLSYTITGMKKLIINTEIPLNLSGFISTLDNLDNQDLTIEKIKDHILFGDTPGERGIFFNNLKSKYSYDEKSSEIYQPITPKIDSTFALHPAPIQEIALGIEKLMQDDEKDKQPIQNQIHTLIAKSLTEPGEDNYYRPALEDLHENHKIENITASDLKNAVKNACRLYKGIHEKNSSNETCSFFVAWWFRLFHGKTGLAQANHFNTLVQEQMDPTAIFQLIYDHLRAGGGNWDAEYSFKPILTRELNKLSKSPFYEWAEYFEVFDPSDSPDKIF